MDELKAGDRVQLHYPDKPKWLLLRGGTITDVKDKTVEVQWDGSFSGIYAKWQIEPLADVGAKP